MLLLLSVRILFPVLLEVKVETLKFCPLVLKIPTLCVKVPVVIKASESVIPLVPADAVSAKLFAHVLPFEVISAPANAEFILINPAYEKFTTLFATKLPVIINDTGAPVKLKFGAAEKSKLTTFTATFIVTVAPVMPIEASKIALSVLVGIVPAEVPPDVRDQCALSFQFPVPPIQ